MKFFGTLAMPVFWLLFLGLAQGAKLASPVQKVVKLLNGLKSNITLDGTNEQQIYDNYACWCEATTARKASAITTARDDLRRLGQDILRLKGKSVTLAAEITKLDADIKDNEEAQATATSIRQKESAAFMAESVELKDAIAATEKAVIVLKDATSSSFLQSKNSDGDATSQESVLRLRAVLAALPVGAKVQPAKLAMVRRAASTGKARYAPQSATIQGILTDMYLEFTTDLEKSTKAEGAQNRAFEDLIATKQAELTTLKAQRQRKQTEKTEADVMLAETEQLYDDTERQMRADVEFFDATTASCKAKSAQWKERSALRAEELRGINEALAILTSPEAQATFGAAIQPGVATALLQIGAVADSRAAPAIRRAHLALKAHASKVHSLRLARLAVKLSAAKSGHFDEVIAAIDTMIQTLKDEEGTDIGQRDNCIEEYKNINSTVANHTWLVKVNNATIAKLQSIMDAKNIEKADTITAIGELNTSIQTMQNDRLTENAAFLQAKLDDEDAIALLSQAKEVLISYYANHSNEMGPLQNFLQQGPEFDVSADQAPDATFSDSGSRKGESKGVVSILTYLIEDLEGEIRVGQKEEAAAQLAYEEALAAAVKLRTELVQKVVTLEGIIAEKTVAQTEENTKMTANQGTITTEEAYRDTIDPDCVWILDNFETRRDKRKAEMEGLVQAKEFLAGYQPPEE